MLLRQPLSVAQYLKITGGKFANGALSGVFSRLLNDDAVKVRRPIFSSDDKRLSNLVVSANKHSENGDYDGLLPEGADGNITLTVDPTVDANMSPTSINVIGINPSTLEFSTEAQAWIIGHEVSHIGDLYTMYSTPNKSAWMGPKELKASEIKAYNWSHANVDKFFNGFRQQLHYKQHSLNQISCYRSTGAACAH